VGTPTDRLIKDSSRRQALSDREFKLRDGSLTSSFRVQHSVFIILSSSFRVRYSLITILLSYRSVSSPTVQLKILPDDKHCQTENLNYGMVLSLHYSFFIIPCSLFLVHHSFVLSVGVLTDRTIKDSSRRQALSDREFKLRDGSLTSSFCVQHSVFLILSSSFRVRYSLFTILLSYRSVSSPTAQLKILPDDKHCQTENLNYGMVLSLHHSVFEIRYS
jgi:hypothetical protein